MRLGEAPPEPTAALVARLEGALGARTTNWRKPHTGLSPAQRFVVSLDGGGSVFVKAAVDAETERMLRTERNMLEAVETSLVPDVVAWIESGAESVLVTEDLSDAYWPADHRRPDGQPVRFEPRQVDLLLAALEQLAALGSPEVPPLDQPVSEWQQILRAPADFLALGLCGAGWFERNGHRLVEAEATLNLSGDALVHNDVRSDNVCFRDERVILVDWSDPRRGPVWYDRATLALTLPLETELDAQDIAPDAGAFAAWQSGVLVRRALTQADAPAWLLQVLRRMADVALRWVCAAWGFDAPQPSQ